VETSQGERDEILPKVRHPKKRRPAVKTELELDRSPAVLRPRVTSRGSCSRHFFPVEEDRYPECTASAALALLAVACGDLYGAALALMVRWPQEQLASRVTVALV